MRESERLTKLAEACRAEAEAATLAKVREQCLRAEGAWAVMAERALRTETLRDAREAAAAQQAPRHRYDHSFLLKA